MLQIQFLPRWFCQRNRKRLVIRFENKGTKREGIIHGAFLSKDMKFQRKKNEKLVVLEICTTACLLFRRQKSILALVNRHSNYPLKLLYKFSGYYDYSIVI